MCKWILKKTHKLIRYVIKSRPNLSSPCLAKSSQSIIRKIIWMLENISGFAMALPSRLQKTECWKRNFSEKCHSDHIGHVLIAYTAQCNAQKDSFAHLGVCYPLYLFSIIIECPYIRITFCMDSWIAGVMENSTQVWMISITANVLMASHDISYHSYINFSFIFACRALYISFKHSFMSLTRFLWYETFEPGCLFHILHVTAFSWSHAVRLQTLHRTPQRHFSENLHSHAAWLSKIILVHAGNIRKFRHLVREFPPSSSSDSCKNLQSIPFWHLLKLF